MTRFNLLRLCFAFCVCVSFCFQPLGAEEAGEWKDYSLNEVLSRLKYYAFAKIAHSVRLGVSFEKDGQILEEPCTKDFPKLYGNFNCNLLNLPSFSAKSEENLAEPGKGPSSAEAGLVAAESSGKDSKSETLTPPKLSESTVTASLQKNSPKIVEPISNFRNAKQYEGGTLVGKQVIFLPGLGTKGSDLSLFYLANGKLSHYSADDRIVVFDWNGKSLQTILEVKVDKRLRPLSGREYFFR
ncbi:hypothetical protein CH373_16095 [Leptospira perolatii]|uniref:Uncharacterized protein n=1 Tax=Leptospira perolatii TaxID=2023191 RepID=A0A2M9ZJ81_9LEPT|nr:hypothetical protein [Leptospira perolatii]PJZ68417.1 hypothetical protein CH360_16295 [Leptospira perolatii]PJZ72116.1 hypothetical protein CH373_16095 [Leptospira perolatii]